MTTATPSRSSMPRGKPHPGETSSCLALGLDLNTAETVWLRPEHGPLLVFGSSGCGKTQTLKKLAYRLAGALTESRREDECVLIYDFHIQLYSRLARKLGGVHVNAKNLERELVHSRKDSPRLLVLENCFAASSSAPRQPSWGLVTEGELRRRRETLIDTFRSGAAPHMLVDALDDFLRPGATGGLFSALLSEPPTPGTFYVTSASDPAPVARAPGGRELLRSAGAILLMRSGQSDQDLLLRTLQELHPRADLDLSKYPAVERREGEGVLVNLRGRAEPTPVYVDCTGPEMALFDTKPGPQPGAAA